MWYAYLLLSSYLFKVLPLVTGCWLPQAVVPQLDRTPDSDAILVRTRFLALFRGYILTTFGFLAIPALRMRTT